MSQAGSNNFIIGPEDPVLVTGATGFIGPKVVQCLLDRGFRRIRCIARPSAQACRVATLCDQMDGLGVQVVRGDLLSQEDCLAATQDAAVVIHLAAGRGEKSFPDAYMNSVVTTRNLLEACLRHQAIKRFVNVSSFAVYTNRGKADGNVLDESCPVEQHPESRGEAYCFAKTKQDEIVVKYGEERGISYVLVRPGAVYGPGNLALTSRVGVGSFGLFLHLGGSNPIPLTYVDNCAEAIALAGLTPGIDGEVFNVVDDDLPSSRTLLQLYHRHVKKFPSLYVPKPVSYSLCYLWERYCDRSGNQLPPIFNRNRWNSQWKKTSYSNDKLKKRLGWKQAVSTREGLKLYFDACRAGSAHA